MQIVILREHSTYGKLGDNNLYNFSLQHCLRYVDLQKAYSVILGNVYKTLYNISIRRRAEEEENEVKIVLEKRQRSDVSRDETLLTRMERDILTKWEIKQEKLAILGMRVEETVFILKDLVIPAIDDEP